MVGGTFDFKYIIKGGRKVFLNLKGGLMSMGGPIKFLLRWGIQVKSLINR